MKKYTLNYVNCCPKNGGNLIRVHGLVRRSSSFNTARIDYVLTDSHTSNVRLFREYVDLSDSLNLSRVIKRKKPDEIYNLGAQSHVRVSFIVPEYTSEVRDLNYDQFYSNGEDKIENIEEYTSHNTTRLDAEETKKLLLKLNSIREDINTN